ncbi:S66 family peptidase [Rubeoparvulum massiliense]|uniref:S66 family peptidase n=1 Tax=Rubeoparvulum massiliense TaxID=1631346 RepID=UPI00065E4419|nr:S66 peptidase family protein [Rubeoparvulum massiliense]
MIPTKLQAGDEIRVIAPSTSMTILHEEQIEYAIERLEQYGFHVSMGKHVGECDELSTSSIASRVEDIHDAFRDPNVKGILTAIGGFHANQLLQYLDYDVIKQNPKVFCGYSDITALSNAIYKQTGLVTYSGPHFSSFSMKKGFEYTWTKFQKCVMKDGSYEVVPAPYWSDDEWYLDQEDRIFIDNEGPLVINEGEATGVSLGGNLSTISLLQGTNYMPSLQNSILLIEDDELSSIHVFDRMLQSLIQQPDFHGVQAILIGRFQNISHVKNSEIEYMIRTKKELAHLPVVANLNFGHTTPFFTFPVGGIISVHAKGNHVQLKVIKH